eukprot:12085831-Karenia_brevis.AAC.1
MAMALQKGLEFRVLHPIVLECWPKVIDICQKALNTKGSSEMTEMEGLLTIHSAASSIKVSQPTLSDKEIWELASRQAVQAEPFWIGWAPSLAKFASVVTLEQLKEAADMKAACVKTPEGVGNTFGFCGGKFLSGLADVCFAGSLQMFPRVRIAVYNANVLAPIEKIVDGKYAMLTESDVGKLKNKKMLV